MIYTRKVSKCVFLIKHFHTHTFYSLSREHPVDVCFSQEWILSHHQPKLAVKRCGRRIIEDLFKSLPCFNLTHLQVLHRFVSFCGIRGFVEESELVHEIVRLVNLNWKLDKLVYYSEGFRLVLVVTFKFLETFLYETGQEDDSLVSWSFNLEVFEHNQGAVKFKGLIDNILLVSFH